MPTDIGNQNAPSIASESNVKRSIILASAKQWKIRIESLGEETSKLGKKKKRGIREIGSESCKVEEKNKFIYS